jgi:dUTP pyrophosphatase
MEKINFYRLNKEAILPTRGHNNDAGLDLYSTISLSLCPGEWAIIPTGLQVEIPVKYYGQVSSRSGLACKRGLVVHQGIGVIDSGFEGELCVPLRNVGSDWQFIQPGDRIAQLLICPIALPVVNEVLEPLKESDRGSGGFGSTGVNNG